MLSKAKWLILRGGWLAYIKMYHEKWNGIIQFDRNVKIGKYSVINNYMGGVLKIGEGSKICNNCKIATCGGGVYIGKRVTIGDRAIITGQGGAVIEDDVLFADRVSIIANEHNYLDVDKPIQLQGCYSKPVIIGSGSWIGINVTILQGTIIGNNSVVGAGSVVKGEFPDYSVIVGNPARIVKYYDEKAQIWKMVNKEEV